MTTSQPDLECHEINKNFSELQAVRNVSFQVPEGTFFSILGPSGCGKTTLLRMIAGFLDPTSGDLRIKGRSMINVPPNKRPVSMVFQHLALFPMMDVAGNIAFGLRQHHVPKGEIASKVAAVLERVGLPDVGSRRVSQLSGGQQQRIAIARCMVLEPDVLLLDEPLGALDLKLRDHMKLELKRLQAEFGTTFVYITHDQSEALVMSDHIAVMDRGQFEQVGTGRDLYYEPKTAFVAGFVGDSNRFAGKVTSVSGSDLKIATPEGFEINGRAAVGAVSDGAQVEIFVRPEAVRLALDADVVAGMDNTSSGRVKNILFNGANSRVLINDANTGKELDVAIPQTGQFRALAHGDDIHIGWEAGQTLCFAAAQEGQ